RTIRHCVARAWPLSAEARAQAMPYQGCRSGRGQHGIEKFEQAILTEAQVVVQLLAKLVERCQHLRFEHTPSLTRFPLFRKSPCRPGPYFVQTEPCARWGATPDEIEPGHSGVEMSGQLGTEVGVVVGAASPIQTVTVGPAGTTPCRPPTGGARIPQSLISGTLAWSTRKSIRWTWCIPESRG